MSADDMKNRIVELIYNTIDELNEDSEKQTLSKSHDTVFMGPNSGFDSLRLVNLIVGVEERVEDEFGFSISAIANEKAMSSKGSPLRNVTTLADFITSILLDLKK